MRIPDRRRPATVGKARATIVADAQARSVRAGEYPVRSIGELVPVLHLRLRVTKTARTWLVLWREPPRKVRGADGVVRPVSTRRPVEGKDGRTRLESPRHRLVVGACGPGGLTLSGAVERATEVREQVKAGIDPNAPAGATGGRLVDVVERFVDEHRSVWSTKTLATYRTAVTKFATWAGSMRVEDLTADSLARFRAHLAATPRHAAGPGKRGTMVPTEDERSPVTINREIRTMKTILNGLRKARRLPGVTTSDDVRDTLGLLRVPSTKATPLKPAQLEKLLRACQRHDAETFTLTRDGSTTTVRHPAIGPFVAFMLLSGMRLGEALKLPWADIDLDDGEIFVSASTSTKTEHERTVYLEVSPALRRLLSALKLRAGKDELVFAGLSEQVVGDARLRLIAEFGAPEFLWSTKHARAGKRSPPNLRSTCGCYLTNAPAIFGAAAAHRSAAQLGHSVAVAEKHYTGVLTKIPKDASSLEAAMQIEDALREVAPARIRRAVD